MTQYDYFLLTIVEYASIDLAGKIKDCIDRSDSIGLVSAISRLPVELQKAAIGHYALKRKNRNSGLRMAVLGQSAIDRLKMSI